MNNRISVTLITRNRFGFFLQCFSSLLSQTFKKWDAIIIDDSDEPIKNKEETRFLVKVAENYGHKITFITQENLGIAQAWQRGLELSESEFGYRLEDDVILTPFYFEELYKIIIQDEKIAGVGGLSPNAWHYRKLPEFLMNTFYYQGNDLIPIDNQCDIVEKEAIIEVCHLHGLFLYRKEMVEKVGGFSTHMTRIAHRDETDLTLRLWFVGYKLVVVTKAVHWHAEAKKGGSRDDLTVQERTALQQADELIFQERLKHWIMYNPDKKIAIRR